MLIRAAWHKLQQDRARQEGQESRQRCSDHLTGKDTRTLYGWAGTLNPYRRQDLRAAFRDGFLGRDAY
jgi:hypothetical protein